MYNVKYADMTKREARLLADDLEEQLPSIRSVEMRARTERWIEALRADIIRLNA